LAKRGNASKSEVCDWSREVWRLAETVIMVVKVLRVNRKFLRNEKRNTT
jgi:hypothetical protein